jgi:hypothetical protein
MSFVPGPGTAFGSWVGDLVAVIDSRSSRVSLHPCLRLHALGHRSSPSAAACNIPLRACLIVLSCSELRGKEVSSLLLIREGDSEDVASSDKVLFIKGDMIQTAPKGRESVAYGNLEKSSPNQNKAPLPT